MDSLDSIWDEPGVNDDSSVAPIKPKEALFLDDSDDEDDVAGPSSTRGHVQKTPADIDIDALFAGVDDDDDDAFTFKPLAPSLDTEALRREAESRHKNRVPSFTPHAILPSSSPPRDTGNDVDGTTKDRGGDKGKDMKKERRKPARLDEGRLLGPTGFPQLIKDTKNFRTKGKGHEVTDLNRLLQVYQFWTHGLYPKTQFRDTVERIEKLCHSKRMNVSLSVWRDEAHGRVNGNQDPEDDEDIDLTENDAPDGPRGSSSGNRSAPGSDGAEYASSSSRPPSQPPSSGPEPDDDDDFDLDAIFRAEDERRAKEKLEADGGMDLGDEDEHGDRTRGKEKTPATLADDDAMWDELDALEDAPKPVQATSTNTGVDDDQAMWDELDQIQEAAKRTKADAASPKETQNMDNDEDMWDIVNEQESTASTMTAAAAASVSDPPAPIQDDYDIEDMYI